MPSPKPPTAGFPEMSHASSPTIDDEEYSPRSESTPSSLLGEGNATSELGCMLDVALAQCANSAAVVDQQTVCPPDAPIAPSVDVGTFDASEEAKEFLRSALQGCPCDAFILVDGLWGSRLSGCQYRVDTKLEHFRVASAQGNVLADVRFNDVEDVYVLPDDAEERFPSEVLSAIAYEDRKRLLLVVCHNNDAPDDILAFCLLLQNTLERLRLGHGLGGLCTLARSGADKAAMESIPPCSQLQCKQASFEQRSMSGVPQTQSAFGFFLEECGMKKIERPPALLVRDIAPFLREYGLGAHDYLRWEDNLQLPLISFKVDQHFEAAGHTWYLVQCSFQESTWLAPRRLAHLRRSFHDPIKNGLGKSYASHFGNTRFPRGGLRGTTKQLQHWFASLSRWIRNGGAPPVLVAAVLHHLEAPRSRVGGDVAAHSQ